MEKKELIITIVLLIIVLISLGFNIYQYQNTNQLNSKINEYLITTGIQCEKETKICLDELIKNIRTVTASDCSSIFDGVCPKQCTERNDQDCCVGKGYEWIPGRGCFVR